MIFTANTINRILSRMQMAGIRLHVEWAYDWSGKRRANRVWVAHNGQRIELNPNSEWLDHLAYEITTHPDILHNPDWYIDSYCHRSKYTVPGWVRYQTGWN